MFCGKSSQKCVLGGCEQSWHAPQPSARLSNRTSRGGVVDQSFYQHLRCRKIVQTGKAIINFLEANSRLLHPAPELMVAVATEMQAGRALRSGCAGGKCRNTAFDGTSHADQSRASPASGCDLRPLAASHGRYTCLIHEARFSSPQILFHRNSRRDGLIGAEQKFAIR